MRCPSWRADQGGSGSESPPAVEQQRDRTVVDQLDGHGGSESGRWQPPPRSTTPVWTSCSYRGSASSGRAAASKDGRRPRRQSPWSVNCETRRTLPAASVNRPVHPARIVLEHPERDQLGPDVVDVARRCLRALPRRRRRVPGRSARRPPRPRRPALASPAGERLACGCGEW